MHTTRLERLTTQLTAVSTSLRNPPRFPLSLLPSVSAMSAPTPSAAGASAASGIEVVSPSSEAQRIGRAFSVTKYHKTSRRFGGTATREVSTQREIAREQQVEQWAVNLAHIDYLCFACVLG